MSQSGIAPSPQLEAEFHRFMASDEKIMVAMIYEEAIVPADVSVSSLDELHELLSDSQPLYIFYKADKLTFITFVPEYCPIRSKMIYASSKQGLLRELGQNVERNLSFTSRSELSSEGWKSVLEHENGEKPLTESEISLNAVKEMEFQARQLVSQHGTQLSFEVDDAVKEAASGLEIDQLLALKIENERVVVLDQVETANVVSALHSECPSYNVYRNQHGTFFIYTCPSGSKVKERMMYAANRTGLVNYLQEITGKFTRIVEVGDANEIDASDLGPREEEVVATQKFARPSRPGRR